jgi:hypothetical protein
MSKDLFYNKLLSTPDKQLPFYVTKCLIENKSFGRNCILTSNQFTYLLVTGIGGKEAKRL